MCRILLLMVLCWGCSKGSGDGSTRTEAVLVNATGHTIEVRPWSGGAPRHEAFVQLEPGDSERIADGIEIGRLNAGAGFGSDLLLGVDSIVVVFDGQSLITHYLCEPVNPALRYYPRISPRNLANISSYNCMLQSQASNGRHIVYSYRFTEQDYEDTQ